MIIFLKLLGESILFALHALWSNKLRTILSLLGITIGIFAIISVFTVVDALEANVRNSVASLGNNVIYIQKWPWTFGPDYPWWKYMNRPLPGYREMQELQKRCNAARAVAFMVSTGGKVAKYESNSAENIDVLGVSHDYQNIKEFELAEGRYFTESESNAGRNVAIIGADVARVLFPSRSPLGREITVVKHKLRVIGVFTREGESIVENSSDKVVLIPVNYARTVVDVKSERMNPMIMVEGKENVTNDELKDELKGIMRGLHQLRPTEDDDFSLNEAKMISNQLDSIFSIINLAGWVIGIFSILVGGFGIANIMFVSVRERTSLIGIQKSLGAKDYFILLQFLVESVVLCLIGGTIGLLFVYAGTVLVNMVLDFHLALTFDNIFLALFVSAIIGIIAGFVPAWVAARMDPVEAIRSNG